MLVHFILMFVFAAAALGFIFAIAERGAHDSLYIAIADAICILGLCGLMIYFGLMLSFDLVISAWS